MLSCPCPSSPPEIRDLRVNPERKPEDSIIGGINYGTPVVIGNLMFLKGDFEITPGVEKLQTTCPKGYRQLTEGEYARILAILGSSSFDTMTNQNGLNFDFHKYYISSTKTFPELTSGASSEAWEFKALYLKDRNFLMKSISTYIYSSISATKCVRDTKNYPILVELPQKDLLINEYSSIEIDTSTLETYVGGFDSYESFSYELKKDIPRKNSVYFKSSGCHTFYIQGIDFLGNKVYTCKKIYVTSKIGSDVNSFIDADSEIDVDSFHLKPYVSDKIFLSHATAPLVRSKRA